ncbi:Polyhydroxyalkanoic acid synthase [Hyphomicrobiales bacterium]|nr:Polyhydroxyalkanoic acid synthase [Hyphomicrobiales bacterium]
MEDTSDDQALRKAANARKKADAEAEASKAWADHRATQDEVFARTARLRALRKAKENAAAKAAPEKVTATAKRRSKRVSPGT